MLTKEKNILLLVQILQNRIPHIILSYGMIYPKMRYIDLNLFKTQLHLHYKTLKRKFYYHGTKLGNTLLTRLRVNRSYWLLFFCP